MNATQLDKPSAPDRLRYPHYSPAALAGTSFKHEHLPMISVGASTKGVLRGPCGKLHGSRRPPHRALELLRRDYPFPCTECVCPSAAPNRSISCTLRAFAI